MGGTVSVNISNWRDYRYTAYSIYLKYGWVSLSIKNIHCTYTKITFLQARAIANNLNPVK